MMFDLVPVTIADLVLARDDDEGFGQPIVRGAAVDGRDERALWLAVIRRAIKDDHREWFSLGNQDFHIVASLAGINPWYLHRKVAASRERLTALGGTTRRH